MWMSTDNKPTTPSGNLKPPTKLQLAQWIKNAWAEIPVDAVRKSFKVCAISNNLDGSEDDMIKCMKDLPEERFVCR